MPWRGLFFGWMSQGGHSEPLLLLALFYQSTPSCLKVRGWVGWGGVGWWPMWLLCQPKSFCSWLWDFGLWDFGLGLDNMQQRSFIRDPFVLNCILIFPTVGLANMTGPGFRFNIWDAMSQVQSFLEFHLQAWITRDFKSFVFERLQQEIKIF